MIGTSFTYTKFVIRTIIGHLSDRKWNEITILMAFLASIDISNGPEKRLCSVHKKKWNVLSLAAIHMGDG